MKKNIKMFYSFVKKVLFRAIFTSYYVDVAHLNQLPGAVLIVCQKNAIILINLR